MAAKDHVAVRLDLPTLDRLNALREALTTEWHEATQSDVLRAVILSGLKQLEKEHGTKLAELKKRREGEKKTEGAAPEKGAATGAKRGRKPKG